MRNIAILGATGTVGQELLKILAERQFPIQRLLPLATSRSAGQSVVFQGQELRVEEVSPASFAGIDIAFFAASGDAARDLAPAAVRQGAVVIDKSSHWRLDPQVPLAVPEVNPEALRRHQGIIASPNCSTIQCVVALKPLRDLAGLRRVVVSTYQSVSGTGREAMAELRQQTAAVLAGEVPRPEVYKKPIAFNVLAFCNQYEAHGYTCEEMKLVNETRKILGLPDLPVTATAVRVPVFISHAEAVLVETERHVTPAEVRQALARQPGLVVVDDAAKGVYPDPLSAAGLDEVFVGRVRADLSSHNGIWMWVVSDNLRKGAATNAVQIAEFLIREGLR